MEEKLEHTMGTAGAQQEGACAYHSATQHPLHGVATHSLLCLDMCPRLLWSCSSQSRAPLLGQGQLTVTQVAQVQR